MKNSSTSPIPLIIYFLLAALEGFGVAIALYTVPRDPASAALLGLSTQRLLLIAFDVVVALFSAALGFMAWRKPAQTATVLEKLLFPRFANWLFGALLALLILSAGLTLLPLESFAPYEAIYQRLLPFILWLALLCAQSLLLAAYYVRNATSPEILKVSSAFLLAGLILGLTLLHWFVLARHAPVFPGDWYWLYTNKLHAPFFFLILLAALSLGLLWAVLKSKIQTVYKLLLLILIGYALQFGFALLEGRGLDGLRDRMVTVLHAEFVEIAVRPASGWETVRDYEALVDSGQMGNYAPSKPPGQLLLYRLTSSITEAFHPSSSETQRVESLRTFATYTWPLLAALTVVPIFYLARLLLDEDRALLAAALSLLVPSVILIPLQPDQVFYPAFFALALLLAGLSLKKENLWLAFLAGFWVYLILFATFALAAVFPFIAALGFLLLRNDGKFQWRSALRLSIAFLAGLLLTDLLFRFALNYDILLRYQKALAFHAANKGVDWTLGNVTRFAGLNALEFALWIGLPITMLVIFAFARALRSAIDRRWGAATLISLALLASLISVDFFGQTKLEVARLWLFFLPVIVILAAGEITRQEAAVKRWFLPLLFLLHFGTIYFTKIYMDFY